jgi:hypothetical protein
LRERLLIEIGNIASVDLATSWAYEVLTAKNSLTASDAKLVEDAFELRLSEISSSEIAKSSNDGSSITQVAGPQEILTAESSGGDRASGIDKSELPRRGAIATGSTCALSPDKPASSAAASHRTRIMFDTRNHGRSAARPATNSLSRFATPITAPFIAQATSEHGGSKPVSTRSRSPVSFRNARAQMKVGSGPIGRRTPPIQLGLELRYCRQQSTGVTTADDEQVSPVPHADNPLRREWRLARTPARC